MAVCVSSGQDGCIYGIPNCATTVLKIQPNVPLSAGDSSEGVSTFGTVQDGFGKWHGGVVAADGFVLCSCGIVSGAL